MSLKDPHTAAASSRRSRLFDALFDGYVVWREVGATVTVAYADWGRAPRDERAGAYAAYVTALDSEERAASAYQHLVAQAAA